MWILINVKAIETKRICHTFKNIYYSLGCQNSLAFCFWFQMIYPWEYLVYFCHNTKYVKCILWPLFVLFNTLSENHKFCPKIQFSENCTKLRIWIFAPKMNILCNFEKWIFLRIWIFTLKIVQILNFTKSRFLAGNSNYPGKYGIKKLSKYSF